MKEQWRGITGFEEWYEVSNLGRVRRVKPGKSTKPGRIVKQVAHPRGRLYVSITVEAKSHSLEVGRLVAAAFIGPRPKGKEVNHIDYDHKNNSADNLEYVTRSENMRHAYEHGKQAPRGEQQGSAKLDDDAVRMIRKSPLGSSALADHYGVSRTVIKSVRSGRNWSHVKG